MVNFCISQSKEGTDHEADYRALSKNGHYVWIRDVVHVIRDSNGEVESLVGFMFDISERKASEEKLLQLQKELEDYSYKDSLTGIANRRMFDLIMKNEWADAHRNQQPLSLIMIDIDFFKQYNDHYGHVQGDECLKNVAKLLSTVTHRPRDFLARLGGEEFVLVLPETDEEAARNIAENCRSLILSEEIPHAQSKIGAYLTISLGVGTTTPSSQAVANSFIDVVDRRLYQAKLNGRNYIV